MIKRSGAILLTMLYVVTVFGIALNLHYCANTLVSVKVYSPAKACKTLSGKKMKWCKDKQLTVKVKDSHQAESPLFINGLFAVDVLKTVFGDYAPAARQAVIEKLFDRGPPVPPGKVATFIKNCIFRI